MDGFDRMADRELGEGVRIKIHCGYCNIGVFEAEVNNEPDRWRAPKAPWGWETITDPFTHSTRYRCPDCIRYKEKDDKIMALVNLGRPMEQGIIDPGFTNFDLENIACWCKMIHEKVTEELDRRHAAEPKRRGRKKKKKEEERCTK